MSPEIAQSGLANGTRASDSVLPMPQGEAEAEANIESRRLRVLVVDEEIPFPLTTGKRIRTTNLLKHLAKRHDITFLCHRNIDSQELAEATRFYQYLGFSLQFLRRGLPRQTLLTPKPLMFAQLAGNLPRRQPFLVQKHVSRELVRQVRKLGNDGGYDLVHFEWTPYAAAANRLSCPWVVCAHNIESLIWQRYYENERNAAKRWYVRGQWKKFRRFEANVFDRARAAIVVSESDAEMARTQLGGRSVHIVDNGVDSAFFALNRDHRSEKELLFVGSLDWRPNVDGLECFLDGPFQAIRKTHQGIRLSVVGRKPPERITRRLSRETGVTLYADAPDVRPYFSRATMLVVPLRIGGGSRLKIIEAAASGLPVVSTCVGAEGLHLRPGDHYLEAPSIDGLTRPILELIEAPSRRGIMALAARERVLQKHEWKVLAEKLEQVWLTAAIGAN